MLRFWVLPRDRPHQSCRWARCGHERQNSEERPELCSEPLEGESCHLRVGKMLGRRGWGKLRPEPGVAANGR